MRHSNDRAMKAMMEKLSILMRRLLILAALVPAPAWAAVFALPENGDNVVGRLDTVVTRYTDTLSDVARSHDQGYTEMRLANPGVDPWKPGAGREVVVPNRFVLPDAPREGIVINVPEMRLYHFPEARPGEPRVVETYPISIGRQDWSTPHGAARIVSKKAAPTWTPPESIREEHEANGDPLPKVVPAGPDNPLGAYAMRLSLPGYLLHGTNKPYGLGMRVTHGCIRLYPRDIEALFHQVDVGTHVRIINQPFKVGWRDGLLYVEVHPPLAEDTEKFRDRFTHIINQVIRGANGRQPDIDWERLQAVVASENGMPERIGNERVIVESAPEQEQAPSDTPAT